MAEIRLYDIQKDYVFKQVFGQEKSKRVLISLLNAILRGNPKIEDITLMNTDVPKLFEDNKNIRLDVRAKISNGRFVQIEIQSQDTGEIPERAIQCISNIMAEHTYAGTPGSRCRKALEHDERSYIYPKVIAIWILGTNVTTRKGAIQEAMMTYQPTESDDYEVMSDKARIIFIELCKAKPKNLNRQNMLDMWLAFLQNPLKVKECGEVEEIEEAFDRLQYLSADENFRALAEGIEDARKEQAVKERIAIEQALKDERAKAAREKAELRAKAEEEKAELRAKADKEKAELKAMAEEEKAELKAKASEALKEKLLGTAKNLLKMGLSIDDIATATGLSVEEIEKL